MTALICDEMPACILKITSFKMQWGVKLNSYTYFLTSVADA